MRSCRPTGLTFLLFAGFPLIVAGQTGVEYGLGAGRAATMTAPAGKLGKGISGALSGLEKTLKSGPTAAESKAGSSSVSHPSAQAVPKEEADATKAPAKAPTYESAKGIQVGMGYEELIRRFGPALEITTGPGKKSIVYSGKDGDTQLEVLDGKVTSVETARRQSAVVVLK